MEFVEDLNIWTDGDMQKAEAIKKEGDKEALVKQVAVADVLDGWKDGILTIGTLGVDPFNQLQQYQLLLSEDEDGEFEEEDQEQYSDDDAEKDEEVNPLLFTSFEANVAKSNHIITSEISSFVAENDLRKRITLAELFLADSDVKTKLDFEVDSGKKKSVVPSKSGKSFANKFMPGAGDDSRPMKKIQQLMRRMLKRKIHPELQGKAENDDKLKEKAQEYVSFLQNTSLAI